MKLAEFIYELPAHLIAQAPLAKRDQSRLMVVRRDNGQISHDSFANIGRYLPELSVVVRNNTKVIPARLFGVKARSGGKVEVFLLRKLADGYSYEALLRPNQRIKDGDQIIFPSTNVTAVVADKVRRIVRFNRKDIAAFLNRNGHVPLPPYIKRPDTLADRSTYQTVYAKHPGSVAAPTAGLHFTKSLLSKLGKSRHTIENVTLHVNFATFKPVVEPDITNHEMHFEEYSVEPAVFERINSARTSGNKIVAVGTTSCRVLESVAATGKLTGETNLFIYPGYKFRATDVLVTNFHLPHSTLLMLVYAFAGTELMRRAYQEAIAKEYRFFSYGDGMVIV